MMTVRPAHDADADAAIDAVRRSIESLCVDDHRNDPETLERWLANKTPDSFRSWIANPDNHCVVAEQDGRVLGVGLLHRSGEIRLFYLAPEAQRKGFGSRMQAALEAKAIDWGMDRIHLCSTRLACAFYEACGFRRAGDANAYFGVLRCYPYEKTLVAA